MPKVSEEARAAARRRVTEERRRRSRQAQRDTKAAEVLRREVEAQSVTTGIAADAQAYLIRKADVPDLEEWDVDQKAVWLSNRMSDATVLSRKQHIEQIAEAYAVFAMLRKDLDLQAAVLDASKARGRKPDGRTSALRLVLELYISYGDGSDQKAKKRARNLYSRDVVAIQFLISQNKAPSEVLALSEEPGQGLDEWAFERVSKQSDQVAEKDKIALFPGWSNVVTLSKQASDGRGIIHLYSAVLPENLKDRIEKLLEGAELIPAAKFFASKFPKSGRQ